jgi:tRNA pseudouridine32 synthase / 23S rRNA pseudouridine746 synthase
MYLNLAMQSNFFHSFKSPIHHLKLPERFTFPFYYTPHPLSLLAANELQTYLQNQTDWEHNFGIESGKEGLEIGKMFGVLVVQNKEKEIGYLAAFSGKLAGENHHFGFVPPVFDILKEEGFFRKGEAIVSEINRRIEVLEQNPQIEILNKLLATKISESELEIKTQNQHLKTQKATRKTIREENKKILETEELQVLEAELIRQSIEDQYVLKDLRRFWKQIIDDIHAQIKQLTDEIQTLKEERKTRSAAIQQEIFDHYFFLNKAGKQKSLADIFQKNAISQPPAGAGECAAPKLLQFAFLHQLKPIAMAEFWWGKSPTGKVANHGHFYPACRSKCEPILAHMLEGLEMDENPMLSNGAAQQIIKIVYEDDDLLLINKPPTLLSVPGKNVSDSVYYRMKRLFPDATGPLIVHRLDMSTSGLMLIAKKMEVYKALQSQFIKRTIKKRYVAILDGEVTGEKGTITLPLRVDIEDRPRQLVCYEHGKPSRTDWEVLERSDGKTRIQFYPITGRSHQLRVHSAHADGLNMPIVGDDIYGKKGERLYLHAEYIEFMHPISHKIISMKVGAEF